MIQWSWRASPSGGSTCSFHCDHRPLLTNEPSFSIQCVVGNMNTSVLIFVASTVGARQNSELVVGSGSMTTSHLRFPRACSTWFESGPMLVAVMPLSITPSIFPLRAWSKIDIHDEFTAGFGMKSNANSLSFVAVLPYQPLSRLTMKLR